jgi:uncharacterized membrane protein YsdA (DUF1294 family)
MSSKVIGFITLRHFGHARDFGRTSSDESSLMPDKHPREAAAKQLQIGAIGIPVGSPQRLRYAAAMVLAELSQPQRIAVYLYAAMSAITFVVFGFDKLAAWRGQRRVPEKTLHLLSLFGGWPGALLAMPMFRHKRRKGSFVAIVVLIVLVHAAVIGALVLRA